MTKRAKQGEDSMCARACVRAMLTMHLPENHQNLTAQGPAACCLLWQDGFNPVAVCAVLQR